MSNRDIQTAWKYHESTKHSFWSIHNNLHFLDWANRPLPFKIYPGMEAVPLPRDVSQTGVTALSAIGHPVVPSSGDDSVPDLQDLTRILYFSAGITKERKYPGGEICFRAAACTGALYEIELYVVTGDLLSLEAGLYHFNPADLSLGLLRKGDFRGNLAEATAMESAVAQAPLTIICTGTYWRNVWKYQTRTYRHFGWDNGTLLANMLAVSAASRLPAEIVLGFVDAEVNRQLDLDTRHEVSLCLVPIGRISESPPLTRQFPALGLETIPLSQREVEYPAMRQMHEASSLASAAEASQWRGKRQVLLSSTPTHDSLRLQLPADDEQSTDTIEQVILRRGSTRSFDRTASITLAQLSTILGCTTRGLPADFFESPGEQLNDLYLIVHSVQGLKSGAYFFRREQGTLELLKEGLFRAEAYHLGLEQELPADACVDIFFLANLQSVLERFGNRGYRAVQLEAGTIGGRMYLAAYAQRLGATGLTFFDDDVIDFFAASKTQERHLPGRDWQAAET